ncbi:MAG TPA: L-rhamnose/proton symporter RhaT [Tepidisphaeraceae bacterium]
MTDPIIGLSYHWIGGLAAASFYLPYKAIRRWSWETYWLVGGLFSWIVAPAVFASILVPGLWDTLAAAPGRSVGLAFFWGVLWGVGGLTFGLSIRYLGIALGAAIALGMCTAFGTLMPPLFAGELGTIASTRSGQVTLAGIAVCLIGIAISGAAGWSKSKETVAKTPAETAAAGPGVTEFRFVKGLLVATFAGVMSASFAYGLAAGKPIAEVAKEKLRNSGDSDLWQNLPVLMVVLWGGFATNFVWCVLLNMRNRTGHEYLARRKPSALAAAADVADAPAVDADPVRGRAADGDTRVPLLGNYMLAAVAGVTWYLQFFFYSMGETRMGEFAFASWTLHMASIIIFTTLWGIALREWRGTSGRTRLLVGLGLLVLVGSTVVVGYGSYLQGTAPGHG